MFQSKYFIAQLNNLIKGETVPRITIKQLRELKIPFISISKQKKLISEIILLSEELENIERKKKKIQYQLDNKLNEVFRKYEF